MRKLIKIALVAIGVRAFLRWRKRRRAEQELESGPPPQSPPDPADQLRQKLAESRADDDAVEPEGEAPADASVQERRTEVHAQGRATVDEMTPSDEA